MDFVVEKVVGSGVELSSAEEEEHEMLKRSLKSIYLVMTSVSGPSGGLGAVRVGCI